MTSGSNHMSSAGSPAAASLSWSVLATAKRSSAVQRDALVVQAQGDDRALVLLDERQHGVDAALLAADRVDVRHLAAVLDGRFDAGLECGRAGRVDHELRVGDAAHGGDEPEEVVDLVAAGDAAVDVEDVRAGRDLVESPGP